MHVALWITNIPHQLASIISFKGFNINFNALWKSLEWLFMERMYHILNLFSCPKSEVLSENQSRKDSVIQAASNNLDKDMK